LAKIIKIVESAPISFERSQLEAYGRREASLPWRIWLESSGDWTKS